jgi:hypothetical protein
MKRFIDENGIFEIKVPITWKYSLQNENVHTFQEYEIWKSDIFQLSIRKFKDESVKGIFNLLSETSQKNMIGGLEYFSYPEISDKGLTTKMWSRIFGDRIVLFTLTHLNNPDKELDCKSIEDKVQTVYSIISDFRLIEDTKSKDEINSYRFDMFLQGVGATALILNKAIENKAFIEATCLLANQIDALLRTGIVLKEQILNSNSKIETEWIYQGLSDKKKSEKDIYNKSLTLRIIEQPFFDELQKLYENRNRVIHRFIISEITLAEVEEIAYKYSQKLEELYSIIFDLESEQIKLNVGMSRKSDGKEENNHLNYIKGKIGKLNYFSDKDLLN